MSMITPEAAKRCEDALTSEQLHAVREVEALLLERRLNTLRRRMSGDSDQDDILLAFEADACHAHKRGFE